MDRRHIEKLLLPPLGNGRPIYYKQGDNLKINKIAKDTTVFYLNVDPQNADSKITVNGGSRTSANMSNNNSGLIDIRKLMESSTSKDYKIKIVNNDVDQSITSSGIHARAIFGTGKRPFTCWPFLLHKTSSLTITIDDLSGSSNTIRPCFEAFKYYFDVLGTLPESYKKLLLNSTFFIYTTDDDVSLTSSATDVVEAFTTMNDNHDFELRRITFHSDGDFLVRIATDDGRNDITNGWVHSDSLGGDGEYYSDLEQGILINRTTKIRYEFKNLSGATNKIYMALSGVAYFMDVNNDR